LNKTDKTRMGTVLRVLVDTMRVIATLLQPFMPGSMAQYAGPARCAVHARTIEALAAPLANGIHLPAPRGVFRVTWSHQWNPGGAGCLMLIDSHCHLDYFTPLELPSVLDRAHAAGVAEMVTIGTTMAQSEKLPPLTEAYPGIWCTIGVHPHHAAEAPIPAPETLAAMTSHPRVIGIGESGLDYFYDRSPRDVQAENFRANIRAAQLAQVPLAIHARDADDDIATILRKKPAGEGRSPSCCTVSVRRALWPRQRCSWVGSLVSRAS